jgi:hypothetical protein
VQSSEHFSVAARKERINVGEHSSGREGQREPEAASNIRAALPHEVGGEQREDEQGGVPKVERRQLLVWTESNTEQRRHLDGQCRGDRKAQNDETFGVCGARRLIAVGGDDELLPQSLGMRACEFARQRIEAAHTFDRNQKRFIS